MVTNSFVLTGKGVKGAKRGRLSGGVAANVHNDMAHQMEEKLKFTNGVVEVLGLYSSVENLFIGIVYRQPDDLIGGNRSTITEFKPALEKLQQAIDDMLSNSKHGQNPVE